MLGSSLLDPRPGMAAMMSYSVRGGMDTKDDSDDTARDVVARETRRGAARAARRTVRASMLRDEVVRCFDRGLSRGFRRC